MKLEEAVPLVRAMFAAHDRRPSDLTTDEYALVLASASCENCGAYVIERLRTRGVLDEDARRVTRFPSGPEIADSIGRQLASVAHMQHAGRSFAEDRVSHLETFWRREAADMLRGVAGGANEALVLAAELWWAGKRAHRDSVTAEIEDVSFDAVWVKGLLGWAATYSASVGIDLRELADRMFTRNRRAAIDGEENLPADVVDLKVPA